MIKKQIIALASGLVALTSCVKSTPLEVGETAPDFTLKDESGKEYKLSKQLESTKVALLFYRSGDWWPPCKKQLVELQSGVEDITNKGTAFWAISYDKPETLKKVKKKFKLTYPLLSDSGSETIDLYGIKNTKLDNTKKEGVAIPTIFIIEQDGKISTVFADSTLLRHGSKDIIKALE